MSELSPMPSYLSSRRQVLGKDLNEVVAAIRQQPGGTRQVRQNFNRIAIVGGSESQGVIGGLQKKLKTYTLSPNFDPTTTDSNVFCDDTISDKTHSEGAYAFDIQQIPDRNLAIYIGENKNHAVYATIKMGRDFIVTGVSTTTSGIRKYTAKQVRFTENPDNNETSAEAHPDALEVNVYSRGELANPSSAATSGELSVGQIIYATPTSFPKSAASAGGDIWLTDAKGGSLPTGEHQWMVYQMVSDNQSGWDFVRAHPI